MLSIIIPAHLEEKRIAKPIQRLYAFLRKNRIRNEILVITDAKDRTSKVAKKACPRSKVLVEKRREGKGAAIQYGIRSAKGSFILVYDADGATPAEEIGPALEAIKSSDVVIGSRKNSKRKWYRRIAAGLFRMITRHLYGLDYYDTQCGFKLFRYEKTKKILVCMKSNGLAWDVEFLVRCKQEGLKVVQMPVRWNSVPGGPVESHKILCVATLLWDALTLRFHL